MDWFKHLTCSHDDPDISDAWDEFGDAGVVVFWTTLEVYGREFSHAVDGKLTISLKYFERKLRRKFKKFEKIFEFYMSRERIEYELCNDKLSLIIPKFVGLSSNWTKRTIKPPTEAPTEVPPAIEEEVYKEEEEIEETYSHFDIFAHWNSCGIYVHKKISPRDKSEIKVALKTHTPEEIMTAISNYAEIYQSAEYFFSYKWALADFLRRGLRKFVNDADPFNNFKINKNKAGDGSMTREDALLREFD